jgi:hypothetical protein
VSGILVRLSNREGNEGVAWVHCLLERESDFPVNLITFPRCLSRIFHGPDTKRAHECPGDPETPGLTCGFCFVSTCSNRLQHRAEVPHGECSVCDEVSGKNLLSARYFDSLKCLGLLHALVAHGLFVCAQVLETAECFQAHRDSRMGCQVQERCDACDYSYVVAAGPDPKAGHNCALRACATCKVVS